MKSYPQMNVVYHAVDVGNYDAVDKAVVAAVEQFGDIDILINNVCPPDMFAGTTITASPTDGVF